MNHEEKMFITMFMVGLTLGLIGGWVLTNNLWEANMIERDCAQYNPKTSAFEWKAKP